MGACGTLIRFALVHEEQSKGLETEVAQRQLIALVILTEPASAERAGRHVDVLVRDGLGPDAVAFRTQEVREVAGHEARRTALADVGQFPARRWVGLGCRREWPRVVSHILEYGLHQALGVPRQSAKKDLDAFHFGFCERTRLVTPAMEIAGYDHGRSPNDGGGK
jgi:hypothetical protein